MLIGLHPLFDQAGSGGPPPSDLPSGGDDSAPPPQETPTPPDGETPPADPLRFDTWLETQDDSIRDLVTTHIGGLKSALDGERSQRKDLAARLREATDQAEEGSQARQALEQLTADLDTATRQTEFYEAAVVPAVGMRNPRLGWLAVQQDNLLEEFTRRGQVDYPALLAHLKDKYPELFAKPVYPPPPANAGDGAGQAGPPQAFSMNAVLRRKAGLPR